MATLLAPEARNEDWAEPLVRGGASLWTRAEWLWTLVGLALLGVFLLLVVVDYPLRSLIAAN